jgi:hypothetical protein
MSVKNTYFLQISHEVRSREVQFQMHTPIFFEKKKLLKKALKYTLKFGQKILLSSAVVTGYLSHISHRREMRNHFIWLLVKHTTPNPSHKHRPVMIITELNLFVHTTQCETTTIFWDITPCSTMKVNQHLGGTYLPHLQGWICRVKYGHESRCQILGLVCN